MFRTLFLFLVVIIRTEASAQVMTTFAGNNSRGYAGDGAPAVYANLCYPFYACPDGNGNVYIADWGNGCIRKVNSSGVITTVAGNRSLIHSGDGSAALSAGIPYPQCVSTDNEGNLYISEGNSERYVKGNYLVDSQALSGSRIRKIDASGIITTIAGTGIPGFNGDGRQATATQVNLVTNIIADATGEIYFTDYGNMRIRKISLSGIVTTIAGKGSAGFSGDGGQATAAELYYPYAMAIDGSGNIYFTDSYNNRIRKINTEGIITTIGGNGKGAFSGDNGQAKAAAFQHPEGIVLDGKGDIIIADQLNHRIREINDTGMVVTIAEVPAPAIADKGTKTEVSATFVPNGLTMDNHGILYIADNGNCTVKKMSVTTGAAKK